MAIKKGKPPNRAKKPVKKQDLGCGYSRPKSNVRLASRLVDPAHRPFLRLLAATWELMSDAVSVTHEESGELIYVNAAWRELYGYSLNRALGATVEALINPDDTPKRLRREIRTQTVASHWCGRLLNRDAEGRLFPVDLSTACVCMPSGELIGLLGVATPLRGATVTNEKISHLVQQHQQTLSRELQHLLETTLINGTSIVNGNGHVQPEDMGALSPREAEVFGLIGRGMSTGQIARHLGVSHYTIQSYRNHIREKLDIRDASTLSHRAYEWIHRRGRKTKQA